MSRPFDWTPLAAGDPVPGDPETVERAGRDYQRIAQAIETAASRLRTIASDVSMQSDAVAQIRERAEGVAEKVARAQERYEAIGFALVGYARALTDAQATSLRALRMAQDAHADLALARYGVNDAQFRVQFLDPGSPADLAAAQRREATATADLATAQSLLDQAIQTRDEAAEAARRVIDAAKSHDGLNDSRWDNIRATTISVLKSVSEVVDKVAIGAGVLALLFGAVPFLGEFFAAVALIASIASLALKLTLKAFGEGSWLQIGIAAIGIATFGVGKVAIGSAEGAAAGARLAASQAAAETSELTAAGASGGAVRGLVGAGNGLSPTSSRPAAGAAERLGAGAALRRGVQSIMELPRTVAEDLKNVDQFDIRHPITQLRASTPLHPLSFLGERGAAAEDQALDQLPDALRDAPLVVKQFNVRNVALGAFVTTWVGGTGLLTRDTVNMVRGESGPVSNLHFTGAGP